jgi:hypothetical protein
MPLEIQHISTFKTGLAITTLTDSVGNPFININQLSTMAKYYDCNNPIKSSISQFADLIVEDLNGDPVLNVNPNNTFPLYFNCNNPAPSTLESIWALITEVDVNGNAFWKTNSGVIPPPAPTISINSFSISGQNDEIETGESFVGGSKTFTWSITNQASVASIRILDVTNANAVIGSNLPNTGSAAITLPTITSVVGVEKTQVYRLEITSLSNVVTFKDYAIYFDNPIFRDTFQRASLGSDYILNQNTTASIVNNKLVLGGGAGTAVIDAFSLLNVYQSGLDDVETEVVFKGKNTPINKTGICIEDASLNPETVAKWSSGFHYSEAANTWRLRIFNNNYDLGYQVSSAPLIVNDNDTVILKVRNLRRKYQCEAIINGTSTMIEYVYDFLPPISTSAYKPNHRTIRLWSPGVDTEIEKITIRSLQPRRPDYLFFVDSIGSGYFTDTNEADQIQILREAGYELAVCGGPSDRIIHGVLSLPILNWFIPKKGYLNMLGSNSHVSGIPTATSKTQLETIISWASSKSKPIYTCTMRPRNGATDNPAFPNTIYNAMLLTLTGTTLINIHTQLESTSNPAQINPSFSPDLVHLNALGFQNESVTLINNLPLN